LPRRRIRGFNLVELMIVVAIIGLLAAMASYGMVKYLNAARISEAKQIVGNMSRSAHGAFEAERAPSQTVAEGNQGTKISHVLCDSAIAVPSTGPPLGRKYQPITAQGSDFNTGDDAVGWRCLRFIITQPILYQYGYTKGDSPMAPDSPAACPVAGNCYEAGARGDLDGDGGISQVSRTGFVNSATGELKESTQVYVEDEPE
jgi:type IV pilus assembly protein PilA